jgi:hypothetical protein
MTPARAVSLAIGVLALCGMAGIFIWGSPTGDRDLGRYLAVVAFFGLLFALARD